jgi:hypothetical protein
VYIRRNGIRVAVERITVSCTRVSERLEQVIA